MCFLIMQEEKKGLSQKSAPYFFNLQFVSLQRNFIQ